MNQKQLEVDKVYFDEKLFDATELIGAPFKVKLADSFRKSFDLVSKKEMIEIDDLAGLFAALVRARVTHIRKLSGDDLKFIRKVMGFLSQDFAEKLDVTAEHYSRCENGARSLSQTQEKQYRMMAYLEVSKNDLQLKRLVQSEKSKKQDEKAIGLAVAKFCSFFFEMKISPFHDVNESIEFVLCRGVNQGCGDNHNNPDCDWSEHPRLVA